MTDYTRPLQQLSRSDEPSFGGKSSNLGELLAAEIPVPPGFAISTAAYQAFVREAGLQETIAAASPASGDAMRAAPMPDDVRAEVSEQYARLGDDVPVAVRSSAVGEDSAEATFAGQQETYLWVRGADSVCDAVRDCWASLYSPTAISYRARLGHAADAPAMGVTVQLMVDAEVSGVMFTCNPVSGDPSMVAINASWGLGLAVVGGEVTPDDYLVSKVTGEVVREHVHAKDVEYVPDPSGAGAARVDVPAERSERSRASIAQRSRSWSRSASASSGTSARTRTSSGHSLATATASCSSCRRARSPASPRSPRSPSRRPRCR